MKPLNGTIKGFTTNWEKFDGLRAQWKVLDGEMYMCEKHNTAFYPKDEPCWQCWDSCREEKSHESNNYDDNWFSEAMEEDSITEKEKERCTVSLN